MANATSRVPSAATQWGDDGIKRVPAATAATYYPNAMVALDGSGNAVKCDDTAGITFDGLAANSDRLQINSDDTVAAMILDQSKQMSVERPWRISMDISTTVTGANIGTAVYALYDNMVALSTSHSVLVGWIDAVLDDAGSGGTRVLIKPAYAPLTNLAVSSNTLTFNGATGANTVVIPDNLADALSVKEGSNTYLKFTTTDSGELIQVLKTLKFAGTTTNNIISLVDNLADALNVKEGSNSYLKFVTTDSSESIVLGKAATGVSLAVTAGLTSSGATGAGVGYATGAGGTVTQGTDRSTGVTLNKLAGAITTHTASLAAGAEAKFTVTNSTVAATDTVIVSLASGNSGVGTCLPWVSAVGSGSFDITITNTHASTAETGACVLNFAVLKAVAS